MSICVIVSIAGCQSQREDRPIEPGVEEVTIAGDITVARIQSARQFVAQGDFAAAGAELRQVDIATILSPREQFEWAILNAEIDLGLGAFPAAEERVGLAKPTNAAQRSRLALLLARIRAAGTDYAAASATLVAAAQAVDDAATDGDVAGTLVEAAWRYAQRVAAHRIAARLRQTEEPAERAEREWWQLINAFNEALTTRGQHVAWERWRTGHPGHIAARFLPRALVDIDPGPARMALFLPFSGRLANAGETVRDGFLSAYFLAGAASRQSIHVYDTAEATIAALYQQALEDGADVIVGPLSKENAADMWALRPTVPTLILNTVAVGEKKRAHPIQFALTVEDEARAIATRVAADGRRRVIVLRSGDNWSARAFAVLSERLAPGARTEAAAKARGEGQQPVPPAGAPALTQLVRSGVFLEGADITSVVGETLLIEASKERRLRLERVVGDDVEFTPRRRADVDAVIALIEGSQLASLRPALAYHFASDLPIYASSQAGRDVTNQDDLELLRICDMPWRLYPPEIKAEMREAFPNNRGTADALFAFGLDAYRLVNQLSRLTASADSRIMGSTGILSLRPDGVIRREPVWALVRNGRFEPLAAVVATEATASHASAPQPTSSTTDQPSPVADAPRRLLVHASAPHLATTGR